MMNANNISIDYGTRVEPYVYEYTFDNVPNFFPNSEDPAYYGIAVEPSSVWRHKLYAM